MLLKNIVDVFYKLNVNKKWLREIWQKNVSIFFEKSVAIFGLFTVHFGKSVCNLIKIDCISFVTSSLLLKRALIK